MQKSSNDKFTHKLNDFLLKHKNKGEVFLMKFASCECSASKTHFGVRRNKAQAILLQISQKDKP
ncbi:hypothetical protein CIG11343_1498 [Campylobacter iguaniorum]|uniref:hypothetical protein n=1 Tax=Campylobacter iguaniorum TaxID=1244531 RepID=UPI0007C8C69A|nr:hypothetical protein [Campylobacter iguaniorum]ANE36494.1 hypothetical protein CIG11343_1498 [Campylobacter iguaniorum]